MDDDARYTVYRNFFKGDRETIKTGLTLEEAQEHCTDPDTSSRTATSETAQERTRTRGAWFDGYTEE